MFFIYSTSCSLLDVSHMLLMFIDISFVFPILNLWACILGELMSSIMIACLSVVSFVTRGIVIFPICVCVVSFLGSLGFLPDRVSHSLPFLSWDSGPHVSVLSSAVGL